MAAHQGICSQNRHSLVLIWQRWRIMKLCIIVPVYNEEAVIEANIGTILDYAKRLPVMATLVVVNDGSQDETGSIVEKIACRHKEDELRAISYPENRGYGAAVKIGARYAIRNNYDYAMFMDSDLTDHPKYLIKFYEKMAEGWDYIKASRYIKNGAVKGVPIGRVFISRCGNIFAKTVTGFPISDFTNGFRCVSVGVLKKIELVEDGFSIIIEELMKARRVTHSFCEIPYILEVRSKASGHSKFTYGVGTFCKYIRYLFL